MKKKKKMLSDVLENCLAWACDDQLDDDEIKEMKKLIELMKDYSIQDVKDLQDNWIDECDGG